MNAPFTRAHREWANRPADESYPDLASYHAEALRHQEWAAAADASWSDMEADADGNTLYLKGKSGTRSSMTNWAFGQVATKVGAPAHYLAKLPAPLAADCLNEGLKDANGKASLLFNAGNKDTGELQLRAATSDEYTRIWNYEITSRLFRLQDQGWNPAPSAFDGKCGLYMGDRDMFAFMVDNERRIFEKLPGGGLSRGFFVWNSEVGAASFGIGTFLYQWVCGNHCIYGMEDYSEFRIRHVGKADVKAFSELEGELVKYANQSGDIVEMQIESARKFKLGNDKDEVLDKVFGLRIKDLPKKTISAAYDTSIEHEDWYGVPNTAWSLHCGITEVAQRLPNIDDRTALERAAGKVLQISF